jgi:hypothetical protein
LFANPAVENALGHKAEELIGGKLTVVLPEYLRHVHAHGLARYVATGSAARLLGQRIAPGLHKQQAVPGPPPLLLIY